MEEKEEKIRKLAIEINQLTFHELGRLIEQLAIEKLRDFLIYLILGRMEKPIKIKLFFFKITITPRRLLSLILKALEMERRGE